MDPNDEGMTQNQRLVVASALVARQLLSEGFGQHTAYGGDRDYYRILGYKPNIQLRDYRHRYDRQSIAGRIVDLPAQDTWKTPPRITEDDRDDTEFVRAWEGLAERLRVWSKFERVDRLAGIGRFGILLLGLGNGSLPQPVEAGSLTGPKSVIYMRPMSELAVSIDEQEANPADPRFGRPTMYRVDLGGEIGPKLVHWTRVIHVADGKLDSEIYGTPRLQRAFNLLDDLMKLIGGGAEATWLNMRQGLIFKTQEGWQLDGSDDARADRESELQDFVHDLARFLELEGEEPQSMGGFVVDVSGAFQTVLALLSAAANIPQRVLVGSAQGQLAAAEWDMKQWYGQVESRRVSFAEPEILRPTIDRLIWLGALPTPPNGYNVGELGDDGQYHWPSLFELSAEEEAQVANTLAQAVRALSDPMAAYPLDEVEIRQLLNLPTDGTARTAQEAVDDGMTDQVRAMRIAAHVLGVDDAEVRRAVRRIIAEWEEAQ